MAIKTTVHLASTTLPTKCRVCGCEYLRGFMGEGAVEKTVKAARKSLHDQVTQSGGSVNRRGACPRCGMLDPEFADSTWVNIWRFAYAPIICGVVVLPLVSLFVVPSRIPGEAVLQSALFFWPTLLLLASLSYVLVLRHIKAKRTDWNSESVANLRKQKSWTTPGAKNASVYDLNIPFDGHDPVREHYESSAMSVGVGLSLCLLILSLYLAIGKPFRACSSEFWFHKGNLQVFKILLLAIPTLGLLVFVRGLSRFSTVLGFSKMR